jgi:hypothetical protein
LKKIIENYDKFYDKMLIKEEKNNKFLNFIENLKKNKNFKISKLEIHLNYKKHLELELAKNNKNELEKMKIMEIDEIWKIIIKRIESINEKLFFDEEDFKKVRKVF